MTVKKAIKRLHVRSNLMEKNCIYIKSSSMIVSNNILLSFTFSFITFVFMTSYRIGFSLPFGGEKKNSLITDQLLK